MSRSKRWKRRNRHKQQSNLFWLSISHPAFESIKFMPIHFSVEEENDFKAYINTLTNQ